MPWGAALMDFDNNGFVDFISTSGKIDYLISLICVAISSNKILFTIVSLNEMT